MVTYGAACSLDGFITGPDGAIDWLHFSPDVSQIMKDYWAGIDTILMGRKTYEVAAAQGGNGSMPGIKEVYVFSRTLERIDKKKKAPTLVRENAGEFVRQLKAKPGKGICVLGGGDLARSLIAEGVVDEVGLNIHPVILGSGTPFFVDPGKRVGLELTECRTIDGGCVYALYRVKS
jgi:dihydrofolate reductase